MDSENTPPPSRSLYTRAGMGVRVAVDHMSRADNKISIKIFTKTDERDDREWVRGDTLYV